MKNKFSQSGMSLVQVLVFLGLVGIVSITMTSLMGIQNRGVYEMGLKSSALALRQNLIGTMGNDGAWTKTRAQNGAIMGCLSVTQKYCNPSSTERANVKLYDAAGKLILDSTRESAGFTSFGEPCDSFSESGNDACPLQARLKWRANCSASVCSAAGFGGEEMVSVEFKYRPKSKDLNIPFNPMNFNLTEQSRMKIVNNDSPAMACAARGKLFIGVGQVFNGKAADGTGCVEYGAFTGPKGNTGPPGPQGPQGPPGPPGPAAVCPAT